VNAPTLPEQIAVTPAMNRLVNQILDEVGYLERILEDLRLVHENPGAVPKAKWLFMVGEATRSMSRLELSATSLRQLEDMASVGLREKIAWTLWVASSLIEEATQAVRSLQETTPDANFLTRPSRNQTGY
jgi:hypothetical protein